MFLHEASGSLLFRAPDPFLIRELIPQSKTLDRDDFNIAVKHTRDTARLLRNLGFEVPGEEEPPYDWPGKHAPMDHQRKMVEFFSSTRRGFNLGEQGVGKTYATLWAADMLMRQGLVNKAVILAPLSTLETVWKQDIFDILMHRTAAVVHGGSEKRQKAWKVDADFYIVNHDGLTVRDVYAQMLDRKDINLVVVDEGSMFRNFQTRKYKALERVLRPSQRVWWLTGTPCPNAPTDAWAQVKIVSPDNAPRFFGTFKRSTMVQMSQFKWAPRVGADKIVHEVMQPAIRFKKADCFDLPPVTTINLQSELSPEQREAFNAMRKYMVADAHEQQITAVNAADKVNKLRQLLCGVVKNPQTEEYVTLPHKPRLTVLRECIDNASAKVIVVVPFKGIIWDLHAQLCDHYSTAVLNGDVTPAARNKIIHDFKTQASPHVLLCHPRVMSHGLNLTEADTLVFYAPIYSNDEFQQVVERFNRKGQTRKMTILRIGAHPIEWAIYSMVDKRKITQQSILDLYKLGIS